jgi:hypothetical protein
MSIQPAALLGVLAFALPPADLWGPHAPRVRVGAPCSNMPARRDGKRKAHRRNEIAARSRKEQRRQKP